MVGTTQKGGGMLSEILAAKFRRSKYSTVKEFWSSSKCKLSEETVSRVIGRGHEPGIPTFIIIAYHLGIPTKYIAAACKEAGDTAFCNLLDPPESAKRAAEEQVVVDKFARIPEAKKKFVLDLLEQLGD
jgi:hypothetical protein